MCEYQKIISINSNNADQKISGDYTNFTYRLDIPQESLSKFKYVELLECIVDIEDVDPLVVNTLLVRCSLVDNLNDDGLVHLYRYGNTDGQTETAIRFSKQNCRIIHKINKNVNQTITVSVQNTSISNNGPLTLDAPMLITLRLFA